MTMGWTGAIRPAVLLLVTLTIAACDARHGDYLPAASLVEDGFVRRLPTGDALDARRIKLWGFVDHLNIYADGGTRDVLGQWWAGEGPAPDTWRFDLKAEEDARVGQSFAVHVPNDPGRDAVLAAFARDARAGRPTKVFLHGIVHTFAAPMNLNTRTGLYLVLDSSADVLMQAPP
jgi:hypothetical protein